MRGSGLLVVVGQPDGQRVEIVIGPGNEVAATDIAGTFILRAVGHQVVIQPH